MAWSTSLRLTDISFRLKICHLFILLDFRHVLKTHLDKQTNAILKSDNEKCCSLMFRDRMYAAGLKVHVYHKAKLLIMALPGRATMIDIYNIYQVVSVKLCSDGS